VERLGVKQPSFSLWQKRKQLPSLSVPGALAACFVYCLLAALSAQCGVLTLFPACISGGILAAVMLLCRNPLAVAAPVCGSGAILLFARDGLSAALALLSVMMGIMVAGCVFLSRSRLYTTVLGALVAGLGGGVFLLAFLVRHGAALQQASELLRNFLQEILSVMVIRFPTGKELTVFSPEAVQVLLDMLLPLLPAIIGITLFLASYLAGGSLRLILTVLGARADFFSDGWQLLVGRECAAVYCGAQLFLLLAITTPQAEILYYASYNTALLCMIPLALCGFGALFRLLRTVPALGTTAKAAIICLAVMLLAAGLYWLFTAAAFYGVFLSFGRKSSEED
jgi:hypothetical protein